MSKDELNRKADKLAETYSNDVSSNEVVQEMNHITMIRNVNYGKKQMGALELLSLIRKYI